MATKLDKNLQDQLKRLGVPVTDKDGKWPSVEDWPNTRAVVVCATSGCPVEGIGFEVTLYVQADGSFYCICGRCGVTVTDMRGDLTPVGQDILAELKSDPKLFRQKVEDFKKKKQAKQSKDTR
ncbi:hypothetical protein [Streptomyces sp. NPDC088847]|uniref:hypothetical protein n=1 Tax=Streptomyces sp. NPDC088847 TaxID=3365909 RepID=UPI00380D6EDA